MHTHTHTQRLVSTSPYTNLPSLHHSVLHTTITIILKQEVLDTRCVFVEVWQRRMLPGITFMTGGASQHFCSPECTPRRRRKEGRVYGLQGFWVHTTSLPSTYMAVRQGCTGQAIVFFLFCDTGAYGRQCDSSISRRLLPSAWRRQWT